MSVVDLLEPYDLGDPAVTARIERGFRSQVWVLRCARGVYVLRRFDSAIDERRVRLAATCQEHLARAGLAPRLWRTRDGRRAIRGRDGAFYCVSRYVAGEPLESARMDPAAWARLGALLGRVHDALATFVYPQGSPRSYLTLHASPEDELEQLLTRGWLDRDTAEALSTRLSLLHALGRPKALDHARMQWVHGDFWVDNVIAMEAAPTLVSVDFDQTCEFYPHYELIRGYVASRAADQELGGPSFAAFLDGFLAGRPHAAAHVDGALSIYLHVSLGDTRPYRDPAMVAYARARTRLIERVLAARPAMQRALDRAAAGATAAGRWAS